MPALYMYFWKDRIAQTQHYAILVYNTEPIRPSFFRVNQFNIIRRQITR